jgi:hypothetical protein
MRFAGGPGALNAVLSSELVVSTTGLESSTSMTALTTADVAPRGVISITVESEDFH